MTGLLADGWFYISSAGLLVSGVLFFFLLGQYRAAGDAADQPEPEAAAEPHAPLIRPLSLSEGGPSSAKIASVPAESLAKPADRPAPAESKREAASVPVDKRRETATGGVNPAVVYLQNIKNQLEELHSETRVLAKRVEAITDRDEALIERLSELAQAVADLKGANTSAPAPAEPAAPKRAKKASPVLAAKIEEARSKLDQVPLEKRTSEHVTASAQIETEWQTLQDLIKVRSKLVSKGSVSFVMF